MECESCKANLENGYQSNVNLQLCIDCEEYKAQNEEENFWEGDRHPNDYSDGDFEPW